MNTNNKKTKLAIKYLISKLGNNIEGKKKLMKLMFLVEHYNINTNKLTSTGTLGNKYKIYYYGVFSSDVMYIISELINDKKIVDGFPLTLNEKSQIEIDIGLKKITVTVYWQPPVGSDEKSTTISFVKANY